MEIKDFLLLMWRGVLILIIGVVLGAGVGVAAGVVEQPLYDATTQVLVSRPRLPSETDVLPLGEDQLVVTNALLVKTKPVRDAASAALGVKVSASAIRVTALSNSLIIEITVQDANATQAASIANELVRVLVEKNDALLSDRYDAIDAALNARIAEVKGQITSLTSQFNQMNAAGIEAQLVQVNREIDQLGAQQSDLEGQLKSFPATLSDLQRLEITEKQAQIQQLRTQLNLYQQVKVNLTYVGKAGSGGASRDNPSLTAIQSTLSLYQQIYNGLLNSLAENRSARLQSMSSLVQMDPAVPPKAPVRPRPVLYVLVGSLAGLLLAVSSVLILDHLTNPLKTGRQAEESLGVPVLGSVSASANLVRGSGSLHVPRAADRDAYRSLGAGIELAEKHLSTLLISNAGPAEGKTTVAGNLAVVYARQGRHVILLDADLRHPHIHRLFGIENQKGLANILRGNKNIKSLGSSVDGLDGLTVIPSGGAPDEATGWLSAEKWEGVLSELQKQADLIIVEGPSSEQADAQMLASTMRAVLLVVKPGHTSTDSARATLKRFQLAGAIVVGAVLARSETIWFPGTEILAGITGRLRKKEAAAESRGRADDAASQDTVPLLKGGHGG